MFQDFQDILKYRSRRSSFHKNWSATERINSNSRSTDPQVLERALKRSRCEGVELLPHVWWSVCYSMGTKRHLFNVNDDNDINDNPHW